MEISKKFEDRLKGPGAPNPFAQVFILKQEMKGIVRDKRVNLQAAENGFVVSVSMDVEFGKGEKREYRYICKTWVFPKLEDAMPKLQEEMSSFKPGQEISMADIETKKGEVKVHAYTKKQMVFATGEFDGHVHMAVGDIVEKTVNGKPMKVFQGETMDNAVFWKLGKPEEGSNETDFTKKVAATLAVHKHTIEVPLTKLDMAGFRVQGSTKEMEGHSHHVDILDILSTPMSNTPDQA